MAFLPSVLICRRLLSRSSISSPFVVHTHRLSTTTKTKPVMKIQNSSSPSPPWLVLPHYFNYNLGDCTSTIDFNFYSFAEKRVVTLPQAQGLEDLIPMTKPVDDLTYCGSSRGWIALFDSQTLDVFIYNPITLRHIKLPPIHNLPSYPKDDIKLVKKLILSCCPDEDEQSCRAVMICNSRTFFCCPGHSKEWTPFGLRYVMDDERSRGNFLDIVYSSRQNLFFGLSDINSTLETWDLSEPSSPRFIKTKTYDDKYLDISKNIRYNSPKEGQVKYLVVADGLFSDDVDVVLLVTRNVIQPDDSYDENKEATSDDENKEASSDDSYDDDSYDEDDFVSYGEVTSDDEYGHDSDSDLYPPNKSIGFKIHVYDQEEDGFRSGLLSLGDMALFIGSCSDSVALSTTIFPELKSNSIYFTEGMETDRVLIWRDFGTFDLKDNTMVGRRYCPLVLFSQKTIEPSPIWFFPRL